MSQLATEVDPIQMPLTVRRWTGPAGPGRNTREVVRDARDERIGFVAQPSGVLFLEVPYEARRADVVEALEALGVQVTGPRRSELDGLPFDVNLRLWPSQGRVNIDWEPWGPAAGTEPAGTEPADQPGEAPEASETPETPAAREASTHELLPPFERARYLVARHALDVAWEGWREIAVAMLARAGVIDPTDPPHPATKADGHRLPRWRPERAGVPKQRRPQRDEWSAHPFDLAYVSALTDDLEAACADFAAGAAKQLVVGEPTMSVQVVFRRADASDPGAPVTALLRRGGNPRDADSPVPSGWSLDERPGRRRIASAGPLAAGPDLPARMVELCVTALAWSPAARPPQVEVRIRFGGFGTRDHHQRQRERDEAQARRRRGFESAARRAAVARWHAAREAARGQEPQGDDQPARLHREVSETAWNLLRVDPGEVGRPGGEPLSEMTDPAGLLAEVRTLADWRPPAADELYWLSEADRMVRRCQVAFAHSWLAGDGVTARILLDEILRIGSPRSPEAGRAGRTRLALGLLDGDVDAALIAGTAAMRRTGYASLLDYLDARNLLPEQPDSVRAELSRRATEVTDPGELGLASRASRAEIGATVAQLTAALVEVVAQTCTDDRATVHVPLSDRTDGEEIFVAEVGPAGLLLSTWLEPDGGLVDSRVVQRLRDAGFTVEPDIDGDRLRARVRLWAGTEPGQRPPAALLEQTVRLAVELVDELHGDDISLLAWQGAHTID